MPLLRTRLESALHAIEPGILVATGDLTMPRRLLSWFGTPCLMLAALLAPAGTASAQQVVPFAAISATGAVTVDDPGKPSILNFDLKSRVSLGANSNGLNPLAEGVMLTVRYPDNPEHMPMPNGIVHPELNVFVPGGCLTEAKGSFKLAGSLNCGVIVRLVPVWHLPDGSTQTLPNIVELLPAVNKFDLRLTPGLDGSWDLKVSIDFNASAQGVPIAGVIAILRSPSAIKLEMGTDAGQVRMRKIDFAGACGDSIVAACGDS